MILNVSEYISKRFLCLPCELCEIHGFFLNRIFRFWAIAEKCGVAAAKKTLATETIEILAKNSGAEPQPKE
jgi:hypothetical protein